MAIGVIGVGSAPAAAMSMDCHSYSSATVCEVKHDDGSTEWIVIEH